MGCHVSVLDSGFSPHPPHAHAEEEILVVLDGEVEVALARAKDDPRPRWKHLSRGQFSYYPAFQYHTIRNRSCESATYLMLKWCGTNSRSAECLPPFVANFQGAMKAPDTRDFAPKIIFEKSTRYLKKLHCHLTLLKPGAGYEPHTDPYDVALILLDGKIEIFGSVIESHGVIYCSAGEAHGIKNSGTKGATYLVFEFHAA
jgi:quercetin dioxygenase-like cupin family protein